MKNRNVTAPAATIMMLCLIFALASCDAQSPVAANAAEDLMRMDTGGSAAGDFGPAGCS